MTASFSEGTGVYFANFTRSASMKNASINFVTSASRVNRRSCAKTSSERQFQSHNSVPSLKILADNFRRFRVKFLHVPLLPHSFFFQLLQSDHCLDVRRNLRRLLFDNFSGFLFSLSIIIVSAIDKRGNRKNNSRIKSDFLPRQRNAERRFDIFDRLCGINFDRRNLYRQRIGLDDNAVLCR